MLSDDPELSQGAGCLQTYREAPARAKEGVRTVSTDELTVVQALKRLHLALPMAPGKADLRECAYIRRGTCAFILRRDVVSGRLIAPYAGAIID